MAAVERSQSVSLVQNMTCWTTRWNVCLTLSLTTLDLEESISIEDRIEKPIMVETTTLKDGHYQIGLPFKHDKPHLPDSLPTARKRLEYLKSKMVKDPVFHERYSTVMKKYEEEGAAREVPDQKLETLKPLWYLPHHAVWHPRKPEEPRIVFDCRPKLKEFH